VAKFSFYFQLWSPFDLRHHPQIKACGFGGSPFVALWEM
jgi:hypothetical protein